MKCWKRFGTLYYTCCSLTRLIISFSVAQILDTINDSNKRAWVKHFYCCTHWTHAACAIWRCACGEMVLYEMLQKYRNAATTATRQFFGSAFSVFCLILSLSYCEHSSNWYNNNSQLFAKQARDTFFIWLCLCVFFVFNFTLLYSSWLSNAFLPSIRFHFIATQRWLCFVFSLVACFTLTLSNDCILAVRCVE